MAGVRFDGHILFAYRRPETWPAGAGLELRIRTEKFASAADAAVNPFFVVVPVLAAEGPLGPLLSCDFKLFPSQLRFPFGIGLFNFVSHGRSSLLLSWQFAAKLAKSSFRGALATRNLALFFIPERDSSPSADGS